MRLPGSRAAYLRNRNGGTRAEQRDGCCAGRPASNGGFRLQRTEIAGGLPAGCGACRQCRKHGAAALGETVASTSHDVFPGGKGLNQSIAAARGGAHVVHVGRIGADGRWLRDALAAELLLAFAAVHG